MGTKYPLGLFRTEREAALAYDRKATELRGTKATLNFPLSTSQPPLAAGPTAAAAAALPAAVPAAEAAAALPAAPAALPAAAAALPAVGTKRARSIADAPCSSLPNAIPYSLRLRPETYFATVVGRLQQQLQQHEQQLQQHEQQLQEIRTVSSLDENATQPFSLSSSPSSSDLSDSSDDTETYNSQQQEQHEQQEQQTKKRRTDTNKIGTGRCIYLVSASTIFMYTMYVCMYVCMQI